MTTDPTTAISRRRRPRGRYPQTQDGAALKREKRIPEYLEAAEVNAIIRAAPSLKAKLPMLQQWRAGLHVSEALALEVADLSLDVDLPTIRVRPGKGRKARVVPVHPEMGAAFLMALAYGNVSEGRINDVHRTTPDAECRRRSRDRSTSARHSWAVRLALTGSAAVMHVIFC